MLVKVIPNQGILPALSPWNRHPGWGRFTKYGKDHHTSRTKRSSRASWGRRMNGIFSVAPTFVWSSQHKESSRSSRGGSERRKTKLFPLLSKAGPHVQGAMSFMKGEQHTHSSWCRQRSIWGGEKESPENILEDTNRQKKEERKQLKSPGAT